MGSSLIYYLTFLRSLESFRENMFALMLGNKHLLHVLVCVCVCERALVCICYRYALPDQS